MNPPPFFKYEQGCVAAVLNPSEVHVLPDFPCAQAFSRQSHRWPRQRHPALPSICGRFLISLALSLASHTDGRGSATRLFRARCGSRNDWRTRGCRTPCCGIDFGKVCGCRGLGCRSAARSGKDWKPSRYRRCSRTCRHRGCSSSRYPCGIVKHSAGRSYERKLPAHRNPPCQRVAAT